MTCRERLMKSDCAHNVNPDYVGGAFGCPHLSYPNTSGLKDMTKPEYCKGKKSHEECTRCWNREIPEEKKTIYAHIGPFDSVGDAINEGIKNPHPEYAEAFKQMGESAAKTAEAISLVANPMEDTTILGERPRIFDSGNRTVFESGAVRDIQEGKGRCDLLPLDVVGFYYEHDERLSDKDSPQSWVFYHLSHFLLDGQIEHLRQALRMSRIFKDPETMFLETSIHYEDGAKKYDENNWKKGIPVKRYIDSGVRHYLKFLRGDTDERHDRAFCWNMMGAIWTCKHMPELNEYGKEDVE